eukprot:m.344572 g.344572  ORF g.344572 m.344572 type:complete len:364 (-) comp24704_c0_seq1:31-1122(-)
MTNATTIYEDYSEGGKIAYCIMYFIQVVGMLMVTYVLTDIWAFKKFQFQLYRLISAAMIAQWISGFVYMILYAATVSKSWSDVLNKCPYKAGTFVLYSLHQMGYLMSLGTEVMLVYAANYALFLAARDINTKIEYMIYAAILTVGLLSFGLLFSQYAKAADEDCHAKYDHWNERTRPIAIRWQIVYVTCSVFVWIAYATLLIRRKQHKLWASEFRIHLSRNTQGRERVGKEKVLESHEKTIKNVVNVLAKYLFSFVVGSLGIVIVLIANVESPSNIWMWVNIGFAVSGLQRVMQCIAYGMSKENQETMALPILCHRVSKRLFSQTTKIGFNKHLEERFIENSYDTTKKSFRLAEQSEDAQPLV